MLAAVSNAVQEAETVWLTNEVLEAARVLLQTRDAEAAEASLAVETVVTNGVQVVTTRGVQSGVVLPVGAALDTGGGQTILLGMESGTGCVWPGSGLVSWWPGEGDTADFLGRNPGVPVNNPTYTSGKVGQQCFTFNHQSSQSVQIPYDASLATPSFSIECWVLPTAQVGSQAFVYGQGYGRQLVLQNGGDGMWVSLYVTAPNGTFYGVRSLNRIPVGEWRHLAGTWDGTHLRIYINGSPDPPASAGLSAIGDSGCPFSIGGINNSCGYSGQYFPGLVDEVSVYDRALFPGEINNLYLADAAGKCTSTPSCAPYPASIVSWWHGEWFSASDWAGLSPGEPQNGVTFTYDMAGVAFGFSGTDQAIRIPYRPALASSAFSVEAWVNPTEPAGWQACVFGQNYGRQLVVRPGSRGLKVRWVISNNPYTFYTVESSGEIPFGEWTHLVGTWDGDSLTLYVNGGFDKEQAFETTAWDSECPFHIGGVYDPSGDCPYVGQFFNGMIDEVTYYSQALSAADVQALYNAGGQGKCLVPPTIVSSPAPQTVRTGNDAILRVVATGSSLSYQWYLDETQPVGDGQSTLYLANVQDGNAGTYTVRVSNDAGYATSDAATLTVEPAEAVPAPAGLFAWWRGEDGFTPEDYMADDCVGNNPGVARSYLSAGQQTGKVGYAFQFNGGSADLQIPAKDPGEGGLNSSSWEGFTIEGWIYPYDVSLPQPIMEQYDSSLDYRITLSLAACAPGSLELTHVDSGGTHQLCSLAGALRANAFQHIALAYKNQQGTTFIKLYVNGQPVAANEDPLELALGANDFYFGSSPSAALGTHFGGMMDELAVYNRALEESEVLAIYNASTAGKIPPCKPAPGGCVSWWEGEGGGSDVHARNPAVAEGGVTFTPGHKGQAFTFTGPASVRVPASTSLNVGASGGFTVEAWVNPTSVTVSPGQPILEWNSGYVTGVAIWLSDSGMLCATIPDAALMDHLIYGGSLMPDVFQHVALTYEPDDPGSGTARLYLNGSQVGEAACVFLLPILTTGDLYLGFSPADDLEMTGTQFAGQIDEVGLYSRALEAWEINALFTAGGGGKCGIPPNILTQPESQAANAGNNVAFTVVAEGSSLTYQWSFDNGGGAQPIAGATSSALTLMDLQSAQAGTYSVTVANELDSTPSSDATLTVALVGSGNPPEISIQPASATSACEGGSFGLSVTASGADTLRYQWCRNGINLNGQTDSTYVCSPVSSADQGTYTVVVYDSVGHITSAQAVVGVHPRPTAAVSVYGDAVIPPGAEAHIRALLTGTGPWTVTWFDATTETTISGVMDNPYIYTPDPPPTATTTYSLTALSDEHCSALEADLGGTAVVTVEGASLQLPKSASPETLTGSHTDFTFGGDRLYYVDSEVHLDGTTTIEGGTVVLFSSSATARIVIEDPDIVCDTGPYRPAQFWGWGLRNFVLPDQPEADYYGAGLSLAFGTAADLTLKYLYFSNLGCGVSIDAAGTYKLYHCQFTDCSDAVAVTAAGANVQFYNLLFADNLNVFAPSGAALSAPQLTFQHITVDNSDGGHNFVSAGLGSGIWAGLNSLLVNVANVPGGLDSTCVTLGPGSGVFQPGGDGSHYLAPDTYQGGGTTSTLDPTLLADLAHKTTHPPLDLPLQFETRGSITLSPQVPRYAAGSSPDRGFYYDALDYTVSWFLVEEGGQVNVLPGTAIGLRRDDYVGFELWEGSCFLSHGTPTRPNTFAPVWAVQEGPFLVGSFPASPIFQIAFLPNYYPAVPNPGCANLNPAGAPPPVLDFRFSHFYLTSAEPSHHIWGGSDFWGWVIRNHGWRLEPSLDSALFLRMRDCSLHGGWLNLGEPDEGIIFQVQQPEWPVGETYGPTIPSGVTWVNNLFDRVNISLDPGTGPFRWVGPWPNPTIDLRLTATNNTFRGGWLYMVPIQNASEGNWVFENNLFDKTVFAQDQYQPLDYDYNAYWPCEGDELGVGQLAHLVPTPTGDDYNGTYAGAHELALADEPPYEPGPLGNFYLEDGSALEHKGSCLPADVGLYHYTTHLDQTKAGEETGNVDIGMHYVATANSSSPLPKGTDTDNIPDYVEDANGNGVWDEGVETKINSAYTDTGVHDPLNTIYDDVDLDGDGMVGRIEKALDPANPQPLVPDSPHPLALTPVTVPGADPRTLTFRVDLDYNTVSSIGKLQLLADGSTLSSAQPETGSGLCLLTWNTAFAAPGNYLLNGRLVISGIWDGESYAPPVLEAPGPPIACPVNNLLQFEPFFCQYTTSAGAILHALLPEPQATYSIELQTPAGGHVRSLKSNATTTTGEITETWDVKDDSQNTYAGDSVKAVFTVTLPASGRSGAESVSLFPSDADPEDTPNLADSTLGGVTVAYAYNDGTPQDDIDFVVQLAIVSQLIPPCDSLWQYNYPYHSDFNSVQLPPGSGNSGYLPAGASVEPLLANLSNESTWPNPVTKNFIFLGHNDGLAIGGEHSPKISLNDLAQRLGNYHFMLDYGIKPTAPKQRYRFVFLAACSTAADPQWAHAFGIEDTITSGDLFIWPNRVQAFVGWDGMAYPPPSWSVLGRTGLIYRFLDECNAWNLFFAMWQSSFTLDDCITYTAKDHPPYHPFEWDDLSAWNFGEYQDWVWEAYYKKKGGKPHPRLRVRGYCGITRTDWVPGYDWSGHLYK